MADENVTDPYEVAPYIHPIVGAIARSFQLPTDRFGAFELRFDADTTELHLTAEVFPPKGAPTDVNIDWENLERSFVITEVPSSGDWVRSVENARRARDMVAAPLLVRGHPDDRSTWVVAQTGDPWDEDTEPPEGGILLIHPDIDDRDFSFISLGRPQ